VGDSVSHAYPFPLNRQLYLGLLVLNLLILISLSSLVSALSFGVSSGLLSTELLGLHPPSSVG
jgi:hypothetical protein